MIAGVVVLHVWALHVAGQNNPAGVDVKSKSRRCAIHNRMLHWKMVSLFYVFLMSLFFWICVLQPKLLGHPDNYIQANPMVDAATLCQNGTSYLFMQFCELFQTVGGVCSCSVPLLFSFSYHGLIAQRCALRPIAAVQAILLDIFRRLHWPWLSWRHAGWGRLCDSSAGAYCLLLYPLPCYFARAQCCWNTEAFARFDHRCGACKTGEQKA